MGKKAKFKEIRRLAAEIPKIPSTQNVRVIKTGAELLQEGVKTIQDVAVVPKQTYTGTKKVLVPTNHNRKMKDLYAKQGHAGVRAYMRDVTAYLSKHIKPADASNNQLAQG